MNTFNRTSMESKPIKAYDIPIRFSAFNRTSMESKHVVTDLVSFGMTAFNRTSMESKRYRRTPDRVHRSRLLIEPVWNRNIAYNVVPVSCEASF